MIDIPEIQLIAVCILGFFLGAVFLPLFIRKPIFFALLAGFSFFALRYVVSVTTTQASNPNAIVGNGIVSAGIMWVIYISMMLLGRVVIERRWGVIDVEGKEDEELVGHTSIFTSSHVTSDIVQSSEMTEG